MADYFDTGFCVRERSWHGKEVLLDEHPESWDDARRAAGLMWEPTTEPLYKSTPETETVYVKTDDGLYVPEERRLYAPCTKAKEIVRDDTGATLGVVSDGFQLITHAQMGLIIEDFLGQPNVKFDTAGSVRGGAQVYATIMLDEPYTIRGDVDGFGDEVLTVPYFVLLNSHDGTGSCKGLYTQVRVVCANTYQAADMDGDRTGAQFVIRHTSGAGERINEAREIVKGAQAEALRWRALAEELALLRVSPEQESDFMREFLPSPPEGLITERVRANIEKDRAAFEHIYRESASNCGMQGTGLGLVNTAVEYLDHVRGHRSSDTLVGRQLLRAEPLKAKAVRLVRELTSAGV